MHPSIDHLKVLSSFIADTQSVPVPAEASCEAGTMCCLLCSATLGGNKVCACEQAWKRSVGHSSGGPGLQSQRLTATTQVRSSVPPAEGREALLTIAHVL